MNEDTHRGIIDVAWNAIKEGYRACSKHCSGLIFHEEKYGEFARLFEKQYNDVLKRFMKEGTTALDTHKQAAILTISCLEANVIEHELNNPDQISIAPQLIAVNVALSYMKDCINDVIKRKGFGKHIDKYYFPVAIACETPYEQIICRILYHEQNEPDMSFNVLELADRYFLLEYITLLYRGIEPSLLKE